MILQILRYYIIIVMKLFYFIFLIFIVIVYKIHISLLEPFSLGYGTSYGDYINPDPKCNVNQNCFAGNYYRSQVYQNMCELDNKGPLKVRRQLHDSCVRHI